MRTHKITVLLLCLLFIIPTLTIYTQDSEMTEDSVTLLRTLSDALYAGDLDLVMSYISDEAELHSGNLESEFHNLGNKENIRDLFAEIIATHRFEIFPVAMSPDQRTVITDTRLWIEPFTELGPVYTSQIFNIENGEIVRVYWLTTSRSHQKAITDMIDPHITMDHIIGQWTNRKYSMSIDFKDDGTYLFYDSKTPTGEPVDTGTFTVENNMLALTSDNNSTECEPGNTGNMHIHWQESWTVAVMIDNPEMDTCDIRKPPVDEWVHFVPFENQ